ncbi:hypothetical protein YKV012c [Yokapox virus]|uniref:Uncharacterized protein n=1 Tax=Yokapox virus TaxID=1076255 RepID=G3EI90_9POXV|nr:hypothetical protein YKV012c [Yokapox virus]AEN03601.1 unknown protein [Yokapox virus]
MNKILNYFNSITDDEFKTIISISSDFLYLSDNDNINITKESLALEILEQYPYPNDYEKILSMLLLALGKYVFFETIIDEPKPAIRFSKLDKMKEDIKLIDVVKTYFKYLDKDIKLCPLFEKIDEYRLISIQKYKNELNNAIKYFNTYKHLIFYNIHISETDYCTYIIGFLAALVKIIGYEKAFNKFIELVSVDDRRRFKKKLISIYN